MDSVKIEQLSADKLSGVIWHFFLLRKQLVVDAYMEVSRPSSRHKFKIMRAWSRLDSRDSTIKQNEIPFTPEIAAAAKAAYLQMIDRELSVGFQGN